MKIEKTYIKNNDCYKAGIKIAPKGIMLHSTATPGVMASQWFSRWNKSGIAKAVHAFVDDKVVCQHLPWNHRAWHCGDKANNTHISFEMCEPSDWKTNKEYFKKCYENSVEFCVYLCKAYKLTEKNIVSHKEGYEQGIASNHGDPDHWWKFFGYTMDDFRADVKKRLGGSVVVETKKPTLQNGSIGSNVKYLQKRLNKLKGSLNLSFSALHEDGCFGALTEKAVKEFQTKRKLVSDGIVGEKTWEQIEIDFGDVNTDGKVNASDALKVLQASVGKAKLNEEQKKAADMNADGKINAVDASQILKASVKGGK